ncbi:Uncharacterized protein GBIM_07766 [Gryllus bimaculatus]|nr:Uncharacterized protein GBIM_07766 [Gryllus bimaculatus]
MAQNSSIIDDAAATPTASAFETYEEGSSPLGDYCSAATLVDQIIDVDNLVTRLLKVLRIIQLENETCIDELHDERIQLAQGVRQEQENRREVQEKLTNWEQLGSRLRSELEEARLQLQLKVQELDDTKVDLQSYKEQVEIREAEAEKALQQWQENGDLPSPDVLARIVSARNEIPILKEQLAEKELQLAEIGQKSSVSKQLLTENWHRSICEVRRQYDAIDRALETLQSIQSVVMQCPPLAKMQQELEESNFQSISSLSVVQPDLNANAALVTSNGTHNNGKSCINAIHGTL